MAKTPANFELTQANGYPYGRPEGRAASELDELIIETIEKLPLELRLYPDVYSWRISEAVSEHFAKRFPQIADSLTSEKI